jgi:hypothetical protein
MALLQKAYLGATPLFRNTSWFEGTSSKPINESGSVTVTADTNAHTKGAWSELVSSTSANASYIVIEVSSTGTSGADTAALLDIGTGASGSETALIENVAVGAACASGGNLSQLAFGVPIKIVSGTRLSARIQSVVTGGRQMTVNVWIFDMGDYAAAPTSVDVLGTGTANSAGKAMNGASGTWVQVVDSTSRAYRAVIIVPSASATALATIVTEYRLGSGASGSEVEVGRTFANYTNAEQAGTNTRLPTLIAGAIPSGTRLSVRHTIATGPGAYDITLIGIP